MQDLISWLVEDGRGYPFIFGTLLLSGIGIPIPEDVPLMAAGVLAAHGGLGVPVASVLCIGFLLARDSIVFFLGRRYGMAALTSRFGQRIVKKETAELMTAKIREHGIKVVLGGRFAVGVRSAIFFAAGVAGVSPRAFLAADGAAAVISVPLWILLGWYFAEQLERLTPLVEDIRFGLVLALVLAILFLVLRARRVRSEEA